MTSFKRAEDDDYMNWSNEDLIKRVTNLEGQLRAQHAQYTPSRSSSRSRTPPIKKPKKAAKPFDSSKYSTRHIALKFAYLGKKYNGFEHHTNNKTPLPTVEEELWKALRKTKLIFPQFRDGQSEDEVCWDGCEYSKCGRTDRGVSAFGQVIGLTVRSSQPKEKAEKTRDDAFIDTGMNGGVSEEGELDESDTVSRPSWDPLRDELPYIQLLNRVLPPEIRVLAWCPNPPRDFSARFNCKERRYRYFFTNPAYIPEPSSSATKVGGASLDIPAMQRAASKLEGLHDFRNFCKVDPSKQITNFERRIFRANIVRSSPDSRNATFLERPPTNSEPLEVFYFEVHGSAFLWHQVRHMVAIMFLVGQGYESPDIVDKLLDVKNCLAKPLYEMADETPLVLWDCIFPDDEEAALAELQGFWYYKDALEWIYVGDTTPNASDGKRSLTDAMQDRKYGRLGIMEDLWSQWRSSKIDEVLAGNLMDVVASHGQSRLPMIESRQVSTADGKDRTFDGSETPRNVGNYVPLMQRQRMELPEVLNARYAVRKGLTTPVSAIDDAVD